MVRTIKKYTLESFSECTGVGNVVEVGRKSVPGGWATVVCLLQTKAPISKPDLQNSRNYLQCPLPLLGTSVDALQHVMNFQFCGLRRVFV